MLHTYEVYCDGEFLDTLDAYTMMDALTLARGFWPECGEITVELKKGK